ncbi:MAG: VWA-like domain-containing protein, partial [Rubrivivax sp.]
RRHEAPLVLVIGDDAVREVRHCDAGHSRLREIRVQGGGGTDFAPLIAEALRHAPDIVVVLTDLQGPTGPAPRCPVIWAVPPAWRQATAAFGRVLVMH